VTTFKGRVSGNGQKIALVISRFNEAITFKLRDGATAELLRLGVAAEAVDVFEVPGSYELPPVTQRVAESGKYDAVVCLGAVIRGATSHFDYVAGEAAKGIAMVAGRAACPVIFGVLTCDTEEQAYERAGGKAGNKGAECARAALEMADLYRQLG
jgi:6,7-dimethyl-8-ribityllumazine synthase